MTFTDREDPMRLEASNVVMGETVQVRELCVRRPRSLKAVSHTRLRIYSSTLSGFTSAQLRSDR